MTEIEKIIDREMTDFPFYFSVFPSDRKFSVYLNESQDILND